METIKNTTGKLTRSLTFKAVIIAVLALLMLIPGAMIQELIRERQRQSLNTVEQINNQWSWAQTVRPPVLAVPYSTVEEEKTGDKIRQITQLHTLYITPENVEIDVRLFPESRHISIYKSIVYKSDINMSGSFSTLNELKIKNSTLHFDRAYIIIGISDLRGISQEIDFTVDGKPFSAKAGESNAVNRIMTIALNDSILKDKNSFSFNCNMKLKGSDKICFVPVAKNTKVGISGDWTAPGFIGDFLPDYNIDKEAGSFSAEWNVLSFNRSIPETWSDNSNIDSPSFGVSLVQTVDHYQQNMRSAKYALMFIALTFVVFLFVEAITKKNIHPIQYLLVGFALILFYSLLLSISEYTGFASAYLIASAATVSLVTVYASSIFKLKKATVILAAILVMLYTFLYVVLQLEDMALLIGSLGLFAILGIIMFISRRITWYNK